MQSWKLKCPYILKQMCYFHLNYCFNKTSTKKMKIDGLILMHLAFRKLKEWGNLFVFWQILLFNSTRHHCHYVFHPYVWISCETYRIYIRNFSMKIVHNTTSKRTMFMCNIYMIPKKSKKVMCKIYVISIEK